MKGFLTRTFSGILILLIALIFTYLQGFFLLSLLMVLSVLALYELLRAFNKMDVYPPLAPTAAAGVIILLSAYFYGLEAAVFWLQLYTISGLVVLLFSEKLRLMDLITSIFAIVYIILPFVFYLLLDGTLYIWFIYICAWGTDTFAYLIGMLFGRHKLIERISPKKTIEGSIGGIIGSVLIGYLFIQYFQMENSLLLMIMVLLGSVIAQLGDLAASQIKRMSHMKDYGDIIAGHGGIMDRFDSILFAMPFVYYYLNFFVL